MCPSPLPHRASRLSEKRITITRNLAPHGCFEDYTSPRFPFRYFHVDGQEKRRCCGLMWAVRTGEASRSNTPPRKKIRHPKNIHTPLSGFPYIRKMKMKQLRAPLGDSCHIVEVIEQRTVHYGKHDKNGTTERSRRLLAF